MAVSLLEQPLPTAADDALRIGNARAADKFDLIIATPGSEVNMLLSGCGNLFSPDYS